MYEHSFLAKNQKLAPKWSGPFHILCLKGKCYVQLLLSHNNKNSLCMSNDSNPILYPKMLQGHFMIFFPHPLNHLLLINGIPPPWRCRLSVARWLFRCSFPFAATFWGGRNNSAFPCGTCCTHVCSLVHILNFFPLFVQSEFHTDCDEHMLALSLTNARNVFPSKTKAIHAPG